MKKILFFPLIILGLFFCLPVLAEEIKTFDATISINPDSTILVSEKISYDFGTEQKHGIYRDIPVKYMARGGKFNLRLTDITVTDEKNTPVNFEIVNQGNYKRIKIGKSDTIVTGLNVYIINYKIGRAVNFFSDHDELYWNVTGNEWDSQIDESKAAVNLPANVNDKDVKSNCYVGPVGSTNSCISDRFVYNGQDQINQIVFTHDRLNPREGLTIVVGLPKGVVQEPSIFIKIFETAQDNWIIIFPILALVFLYWRWRNFGMDPKGRGTIIAQFDSPDDLSPAEVSAVVDEKVVNKDISAEIISLAIKGYLKLNRLDDSGIFKTKDYELEKSKEPDSKLAEYEIMLLNALFGSSQKIKLSELKNEFYKDLEKIKKEIYNDVVKKGYFASNPYTVRGIYYAIGIIIACFSFFVFDPFGIIGVASMIISGVLFIAFGRIMPAKTQKGVLAKEYILGLKEYMQVAEKDRIDFHNNPAKLPEKTPALFEKLLPFALVLGVSNAWAKQFEGIYNKQPNWYHDPTGVNFSAIALSNDLSGFEAKAATVLASAPSGNSGFSGGGVGGGFGGGGGGSW